MAIDCSCIIQFLAGTVLEIFAKSEGWNEYSPYEYKVSVIEGEAITSMGIETGLKMSISGHKESQVGKNRRVRDNESDATWAIKRWLDDRVNNQFAGIAMLRMLGVVCAKRGSWRVYVTNRLEHSTDKRVRAMREGNVKRMREGEREEGGRGVRIL
jgi:hypothetical protein